MRTSVAPAKSPALKIIQPEPHGSYPDLFANVPQPDVAKVQKKQAKKSEKKISPENYQMMLAFFVEIKQEDELLKSGTHKVRKILSKPIIEKIRLRTLRKSDLASRMIEVAFNDLNVAKNVTPRDAAGQPSTKYDQMVDSLIWIFSLNPSGSRLSFEWACEEANQSHERLRNMIAGNRRNELKEVMRVISSMISMDYAKRCADYLLEYVDLTGWQNN